MKSTSRSVGQLAGTTAAALVLAAGLTAQAETVTYTTEHTFSINDVQGGFDGATYAEDQTIICGVDNLCPADGVQPFVDKSGVTLYPVDSEFGFFVEDYVGAAQKWRDQVYEEGFAGNVYANGELVGLRVSNAETATFKVNYPEGTWCQGLGANTVKCSTEHYSTMEHVLSCHEQIPYYYADDPLAGTQRTLLDPATGLPVIVNGLPLTCADARLDNMLYVKKDGAISDETLADYLANPENGGQLPANESTVLNDIAVGKDYSLTFKDDGKVLYRWGTLIKRPNDMRMYAKMDLPDEWKANPDTVFDVYDAKLIVTHLITNNPNDQLRPEDMENEGATGRLPRYNELGDLYRQSTVDCYEGDGDFIPSGTLFKNGTFAVDETSVDPLPLSEDLTEALTNGWYTTIDRDPFEPDPVSGIGPRWRLKANKFGQDIPGLEIPLQECSPVPFTSANIKYNVGDVTVTTINLLDFEGDSPLLTSTGWMDATQNPINLPSEDPALADAGISINGLPLTDDFDLAVYIKGDRKPTTIFNAVLEITYEGSGVFPPPEDNVDLGISELRIPSKIKLLQNRKLRVEVANYGQDLAGGTLTLQGYQGGVPLVGSTFTAEVAPLSPGEVADFTFTWQASPVGTVSWEATIDAPNDGNDINDTATATTVVR